MKSSVVNKYLMRNISRIFVHSSWKGAEHVSTRKYSNTKNASTQLVRQVQYPLMTKKSRFSPSLNDKDKNSKKHDSLAFEPNFWVIALKTQSFHVRLNLFTLLYMWYIICWLKTSRRIVRKKKEFITKENEIVMSTSVY